MRPVIFDFDDTLIESFPTYVELHLRVARELGLRVPSRTQLIRYADSWEATLAELWPGEDLQRFVARYEELADHHPYPAIPGALPTLSRLRQQGHSLWIVTKRSKRRLKQRMAEAWLPYDWFGGVFARDDQAFPKPDPRCFDPVWRALGRVDPTAVFVGDRDEDRRAARGAKIQFVGVRTGPEAASGFLQDMEPADILDSIADLPGWLERNAREQAAE